MSKHNSQFGIYIHFPYCSKRCPYCDFTLTTRKAPQEEYTQMILNELSFRLQKHPELENREIISIYFGGGTPSLWEIDGISDVINTIKSRFKAHPNIEVTLEANPEEISKNQAIEWARIGINRVSLGAQSFDEQDLIFLGRGHRESHIISAVNDLRSAGIENINLDLIHGLKSQSMEKARDQLLKAIALEPKHISLYQLTIESGTQFGARSRKGEQLQSTEDELVQTYDLLENTLNQYHYSLYEVSNASLKGYESKHNSLYWTLGDYLALGTGAHGFIKQDQGAYRYANENNPQQYLKAQSLAQITKEEQSLDQMAVLEEAILVGLRLKQGVAVSAIMQDRYQDQADQLIKEGLLLEYVDVQQQKYWMATQKGKLILDHLTYKLILS